MAMEQRAYSRPRVIVVLTLIAMAILADHMGSLTFKSNMGQGGLDTVLSQRQSQTGACAPCGAPCPSERE